MSIGFIGIPEKLTYQDWLLDTFFLRNSLFWMIAVFLLFAILIWVNRRHLAKYLKIEKKYLWLLLAIFFLGFWARNSVYYLGTSTDGWVYAESAKYLALENLYVKNCAVGNLQDCSLYEQVLAPPGFPSMIAIFYILFGVNTIYASILSGIFSSLTIIIIFFIGRMVFNEKIGLISAAVFTFFPYELLYAGSGHPRSAALFFISLSILFYFIALKQNKALQWALTAVALSIAVCIRQENIILLIPMAGGLFLFDYFKKFSTKNKKSFVFGIIKKFWLATAIFIITQIPIQYWILSNYHGEDSLFSADAFITTAPRILADFFIPLNMEMEGFRILFLYNPIISIAFFSSIILVFRNKKKEWLFFFLIFLAYFVVSASYFGSLEAYSTDYIRYSQPLIFPVTILSAAIISNATNFLKKKQAFLGLGLGAVLLVFCLPYIEFGLFRDARTEIPVREAVNFEAVKRTPQDCTILSAIYLVPTSEILPDNNRRTVNIWLFGFTEELVREEIESRDCVIFFEDSMYSNMEYFKDSYIKKMEKEFLFNVQQEHYQINAYKILGMD